MNKVLKAFKTVWAVSLITLGILLGADLGWTDGGWLWATLGAAIGGGVGAFFGVFPEAFELLELLDLF